VFIMRRNPRHVYNNRILSYAFSRLLWSRVRFVRKMENVYIVSIFLVHITFFLQTCITHFRIFIKTHKISGTSVGSRKMIKLLILFPWTKTILYWPVSSFLLSTFVFINRIEYEIIVLLLYCLCRIYGLESENGD